MGSLQGASGSSRFGCSWSLSETLKGDPGSGREGAVAQGTSLSARRVRNGERE